MRKQLLVIEIVTLLICIGCSGCTDTKKEELSPANVILKNVVYSPLNPVEKENIIFTITLENTGDTNASSNSITLSGFDGDTFLYSSQSSSFIVNAHSEKIVTVSTGKDKTDEGMKSFKMTMWSSTQGYNSILPQTLNINVQPGAPEIYLITTASNVIAASNYTEDITFEPGELVYAYYEFRNVNHDNVVETYQTITVHHKSSWVVYFDDNKYDDKKISESDGWVQWWPFYTYTYPNNWPTGEYQVDIGIQDKITGKTTTSMVIFTLT